jgi:hypothetical protein
MEFRPVFMDNKQYDVISNLIYKSYPQACILYIDEVINRSLELAFEDRKKVIASNRGLVDVQQLFHGTKEEHINAIAKWGFDPTLNKRAVYGYGVYFARDASYSKEYMHASERGKPTYMFLADVLIGVKKTGGLKGDPMCDNNGDAGGAIVTTVYSDGAYPRYIIAFHKEARWA